MLEVGFSAARAHRVVAIDRCPILAKSLDGALKAAWAIAEVLLPAKKPLDIQVTATDTGLDIDVRGSGPLTAPLTAALAKVAAAQHLARLTRHGELVAQARPPTLRIGTATVALPPAAFLQATAEGEAALARLVLAACAGAKNVADLFAGIGPFALRLASAARVTAVDDDERRPPRSSAPPRPRPASSRSTSKRAICSSHPLLPEELDGFDAVVFDPPRQGAQAQARALAASRVPVIVAVSCNPATFARDIRAPDRWRLSAHVRHAGRSIPLFGARRNRRAA